MTRLEPFIVTALGRSPYDEELIRNNDTAHVAGTVRTGQQYDARGRPMNTEAQRQSQNLTRASNEVLAAAGIIESHDAFIARDAAKKRDIDARQEDIQRAYRRRAYGQIALTCGVWGACGLRRRTELYKDYSNHPLLYLVQRERQTSSWLQIFGAGLPALMLNRAIGNVAHHINNNPFSPITRTVVTHATNYTMFHYKYFAILQQLGLVPSSFPYFVVPPLSFMVPFSSTSPFYLPTLPSTWTGSTALDFASKAALVIAPLIFLQLWYRISNYVISEIYDPIYNLLPHASNLPAAEAISRAQGHEHGHAAAHQHSSPQPRTGDYADPPPDIDVVYVVEEVESDSDTDGNSTTTWNEDEYNDLQNELPPRPSNPTPTSDPTTLDALEGRGTSSAHSSNHPATLPSDSTPQGPQARPLTRRYSYASSHSSDVGETTTTLITFDVEATDEPMPASGSYSAELRQAPDQNPHLRRPELTGIPEYDVTATSIMPAHLFADGVTVLLSTASTVLLETIMVRAVAASWLGRKTGGGTWTGNAGMWPVFARRGERLPWKGVGNIALVFVADLMMTGVIWGACMGAMWARDWLFGDEVQAMRRGGEEVAVLED